MYRWRALVVVEGALHRIPFDTTADTEGQARENILHQAEEKYKVACSIDFIERIKERIS